MLHGLTVAGYQLSLNAVIPRLIDKESIHTIDRPETLFYQNMLYRCSMASGSEIIFRKKVDTKMHRKIEKFIKKRTLIILYI
jgi:hypothetical protein